MMAYCHGLGETLYFVGRIRPGRLVRNLQKSIFGNASLPKNNPFAMVAGIEFIGDREVVGVTTDTGTYIAEGLCSHNTNMLKPDSQKAEIVCCSVSNGMETIAYPWLGAAIAATKRLLRSNNNKIASNLKFETRYTKGLLATEVKNWKWDTMLAAHTLDNRPGITSIKFQAFVMLGVDSWDDAVKPYLRSKGGNVANRIKEAPLPVVLKYCGLDSLYEYHVAVRQMNQFGVKPF